VAPALPHWRSFLGGVLQSVMDVQRTDSGHRATAANNKAVESAPSAVSHTHELTLCWGKMTGFGERLAQRDSAGLGPRSSTKRDKGVRRPLWCQ
jgi:hypothetical protein